MTLFRAQIRNFYRLVDFHGGHEGPQKGQKYHIWSVVRVSTGGVTVGVTPLNFVKKFRVPEPIRLIRSFILAGKNILIKLKTTFMIIGN